MAINLTQRTGGASNQDRPVLPTDTYRMRIMDSKMEDDTFAKPNNDGSMPQKIALTFEVTTLTEEQQEQAADLDQKWDEVRIWHRFNPYYGPVREGGPSKLKEFLDNLVSWKLIPELDLEAFAPESLVGVELKCSVVEYLKTMGANKGQPGNKITGFAPIRVKGAKSPKDTPQPVVAATPAEGDALEWDKPADMLSAEYQFWQRYEHIVGGRDWASVQKFLKSRAPKPTTIEGWIAAAEAVAAKAENEPREDDGEDLPF